MTVRITADGLLLREFRADDEPVLRAAFADPETAVWNPGPPDGEVGDWWRRRNDWSSGDHASWAVADPVDDRLLGSLSLFRVDVGEGDAEVGYWVAPGERNRAVARRALGLAAGYAFGPLGLHRVQLFHAAPNGASCSVALAARFAHEGTLRESHRYGDGRRHDEHLHARLATD